jgi:hypothetical protein
MQVEGTLRQAVQICGTAVQQTVQQSVPAQDGIHEGVREQMQQVRK